MFEDDFVKERKFKRNNKRYNDEDYENRAKAVDKYKEEEERELRDEIESYLYIRKK